MVQSVPPSLCSHSSSSLSYSLCVSVAAGSMLPHRLLGLLGLLLLCKGKKNFLFLFLNSFWSLWEFKCVCVSFIVNDVGSEKKNTQTTICVTAEHLMKYMKRQIIYSPPPLVCSSLKFKMEKSLTVWWCKSKHTVGHISFLLSVCVCVSGPGPFPLLNAALLLWLTAVITCCEDEVFFYSSLILLRAVSHSLC